MGTCPHCDRSVTVVAELIPADAYRDDNLELPDEDEIFLEGGGRMYQFVCPECDAILGAGTEKWAR